MNAFSRSLATASFGSWLLLGALPAGAQSLEAGLAPVPASGSIHGYVLDDAGAPVEGATISVVGAVTRSTVSGKDGRFEIVSLPAGPHLVRAHLSGYAAPRAQTIQVASGRPAASTLTLRRANAPQVLAAGLGTPIDKVESVGRRVAGRPAPPAVKGTTGDESTDDETADQESRRREDTFSETAWRLRHARRGILREVDVFDQLMDDADLSAMGEAEAFRRGLSPARAVGSFFADTAFSGQVNFLTTRSFNSPQELLNTDRLSHGIAYVRLGAPAGSHADWTVRGAFNEADISSWIVAGSYAARASERHRYDVGLSYSTQRYGGGNPLALRDVTEGSRNAGMLYGVDTFTLSPALSVSYGARVARYDYLERQTLFSPRAEVTLTPVVGLRLSASASQSSRAPGAEEFLPPGDAGIWLPPQRTFSSLESSRAMRPQTTTQFAARVERDIAASTISAMVFRQRVDDQLVAIFGSDVPEQPTAKVGHYLVSNAGDAEAVGYRFGARTVVADRVNGWVEYTTSSARLDPSDSVRYLLLLAPSAVRPARERLHDVATSVETNVPETSTRVLVLYGLGNGFARPASTPSARDRRSRIDSRFDVQIRQSLPFLNFTSARWEMLVAVRNYFRDASRDDAVYDELLVVRPPKRIVGGVTMHF